MWQYLQMVSGTGNAIDEEPSVGNRYRDDLGFGGVCLDRAPAIKQ